MVSQWRQQKGPGRADHHADAGPGRQHEYHCAAALHATAPRRAGRLGLASPGSTAPLPVPPVPSIIIASNNATPDHNGQGARPEGPSQTGAPSSSTRAHSPCGRREVHRTPHRTMLEASRTRHGALPPPAPARRPVMELQ